MNELLTFLKQRLDEDERVAREVYLPENTWYTVEDLAKSQREGGAGLNNFDSVYIARLDPASVLRTVTALRAVVDLHRVNNIDGACSTCCDEDMVEEYDSEIEQEWVHFELHPLAYPCPTLRHLAAIWDQHADWREEWRIG